MYNLWDINTIKDIMARYGFSFSKNLGQNFIINPDVCPSMAEDAEIDDEFVLEIGPGFGVLSAELCRRAKKVVAIELDKRIPDVLADTLSDFSNFKIIQGDALKLNLKEIIESEFGVGTRIHICANLPYYITSPVIMKLLNERLPIKDITVMVQKETGERMCAEVGSKFSGAVTAAIHYYADVQELFDVTKENFFPSPKVDSEVIKLTVREKPAVDVSNEKKFFAVIRAAFSQRRKSAVNSISAGMCLPKEQVAQILSELGLEPSIRAEKFTLQDFANISEKL